MTPSPPLLAILSALFFAGGHITSKRGVATTSVVGGLLISLTTGAIMLIIAVVLDPPRDVSLKPLLVLAAAGLLAPAVGRAGGIAGIQRLGPSVSVPIQASIYPMFAVVAAMLFLKEEAGPNRIAGAAAIILGVWILSRTVAEPSAPDLEGVTTPTKARGFLVLKPGVIFPVIAGLAYGAADVVRKEGLELLPHATFAAMVAVTSALVAWALAIAVVPGVRRMLTFGRTAPWFVASGMMSSLAILSQSHALRIGDVAQVSPIVASQPLAVFVLSALFLRDLERIGLKTIVAGVTIVLGTILASA